MYHLRRVIITAILIVSAWFGLTALHRHLDPNTSKSEEEKEDAEWVKTSKYWLDRQSCRWVGICGIAHWHPDPAARPWNKRRADVGTEGAGEGRKRSKTGKASEHKRLGQFGDGE